MGEGGEKDDLRLDVAIIGRHLLPVELFTVA